MNNFLVALAVFVIAVLAAAFAVPRVVNWDTYRGIIEEEATRVLGRDVRVGGGVKIRLLPAPVFSVDRITIADTEASTGQPFLKAEALVGRLAVAPLLRGVFQATDMSLDRPELHLVLDGAGGGNWKSLGQGHGQLPFLMSDVALDQVRIKGGTLVVHGPDRAERLRLDTIEGVLSATALEGPFRFRGTFGAEGEKRDLRVSTTRQEADGSIRFKTALQALDTGAVYNFDGRVVDLSRVPRLEGELSAKVAMPNLTGTPPKDLKGDAAAPLELRAALTADLKLVKLANLNVTFEQQGRPQILTGEATLDVSRTVEVDARLAAKWLDLDQVIGIGAQSTQPAQGPVEGLLSLAQRLNGFAPEQGRSQLVLDVEQANLGREAVSGLRMTIAGKGAETEIREFRLGLPGGAQADVKGLMTGSGVETSFDGDVVLRGASLARFLSWMTGSATSLDAARDGAFAMRSRIVTTPGSVTAREFTGELAGTIMQGELGYRWQGRPEMSVLIEGPRVDLRPLFSAPDKAVLSLPDLLKAATAWGTEARGGNRSDAILKIRAGELILPGSAFVDAAVDLEARDGLIRVGRLVLVGSGGTAIDLEGDIPTATAKARGNLRGTIAARTGPAVRALATFLAVPPALLPDEQLAAELAPLRLAGVVAVTANTNQPIDLTIDGDVRTSRVAARVSLNADVERWHAAPLDATVDMAGPGSVDLARRLGRLASIGAQPVATRGTAERVSLQVSGTPDKGLVTHVALGEPGSRMTFTGRTIVTADRPVTGDGRVHFEGTDIGKAVGLLVPAARGIPTSPEARITGHARVSSATGPLRIDGIDVKAGDVRVRGNLAVETPGAPLTGKLATSALPAMALLSTVMSATAPAAAGDATDVWTNRRFSAAAGAGLEFDVALKAERLDLPGGFGLDDVAARWVAAPGRVELRDLQGRGAGGQWTGGLRLDATENDASSTLALRYKDVNPARAAAPSTVDAIDASLSGVITMAGRGTTVRDLIGSFGGRGSIAAGNGRITALSPAALTSALQVALRGAADQIGPALRERALASLSSARIDVPARSFELEVRNGVLAVAPLALDVADGQVAAAASLDLRAMHYSAQWRVTSFADPFPPPAGWNTTVSARGGAIETTTAPRKPFQPLPALAVTVVGPLADRSKAKTELGTEALERELSVRKIERDLEDLERLRQLDEARAKEEAERRSAADSANPSTPAEPLSPAAPAPVVPGSNAAAPDATLAAPSTQPPVAATPAPEPAARPRPAPPPAPKPAVRPLNSEEHRRIFGGG